MPAEARISPIWKKQKLFVACFLVAIGAWFFFDGLIGYPRSNVRWLAHEEHEMDWPAYAKSQGWVTEVPHKFFKKEDIVGQFVFGGLGVLLGAIVLAHWAMQKNRIIRSDDEAVYTPAGTRVPFGAITGVGKKKWDKKGIAVIRYEIGGRKGQFFVDDYKFDTEPARTILAEIEEHLRSRQPRDPATPAI